MTLYELAANWNEFLAHLDEIPEEAVTDTLAAIEGEFEEKVDSIAVIMKQLDAEAEAIEKEAAALTVRAKSKRKKIEWFKGYIKQQMQAVGKKKIETARNVIVLSGAAPKVVLDEAFLDWAVESKRLDLLKTAKPTPDKTAIKKALQDGAIIPFAMLEESTSLTIR